MGKKLKLLLIILIIIVLAVAGYFVVRAIVNSEGGSSTETQYLNYCEASTIDNVRVSAGGESFTVVNNMDDPDEDADDWKVNFTGAYEGLEYDPTAATEIITSISGLIASRDLGEITEEEKASYGLAEPAGTVVMTKTNGDTLTVYVGDQTGSNTYYCMVEGDNHVYVISNGDGRRFTRTQNDMRITTLPVYNELTDIYEISWRYDDNPLAVIRQNDGSSIFNPYTTYTVYEPWAMEMPVNGEAFPSMIESIHVITIAGYVTPTADGTVDLADYGLDDPWGYYKIVTPDGEVQELSFGDFTDDTDYYCYFYDHTTEQIYYTSYSSLSFLMTDPMDVTAAYVLSANLSDIEYITSVQQNGQEDVVQHIRKYYSQEELDEMEEEPVNNFTSTYLLNGKEYSNDQISALYMTALSFRIRGTYNPDTMQLEEDPYFTITLTPFGASSPEDSREVVFYKYNDNFCVAFINGIADFVVPVEMIDRYVDALQTVKDGRVPPYVY